MSMAHVILGLLMIAPNTVYGISKAFEQGISLIYSASLGAIRSALLRLEAQGFVTVREHVEGGRNKKTYSITPSGEKEFLHWMTADSVNGDLETEVLARVFFLGHIPQAERAPILAHLSTRVREQLSILDAQAELMDNATDLEEIYGDHAHYSRMAVEYGIRQYRGALEWLDAVAKPVEG